MSEVAENNDNVELVERLSIIQSKIALGKELKGYGYSYRNAEQILQAVKPLLNCAAIVCDDSIDDKGLLTATATIFYKSACLSVKGHAFLSEHKGMSREQIVGCASSYARKYALQGLLAISDGADDPDGLPQNDNVVAEKAAETAANNSEKVYQRALKALKECNSVSEMLNKKAVMVAKMPEYKADIARAYDTAIAELDALNEENQAAANSHNDDDCPF